MKKNQITVNKIQQKNLQLKNKIRKIEKKKRVKFNNLIMKYIQKIIKFNSKNSLQAIN